MNRKVIAAAIALLILVLGAGGAIYLFQGPTDTRLYAQDATTGDKYPLVFLYAVDPTSGKILTYSPIIGEVSGVGNLKQSDCVVTASDTVTGAPSTCNRWSQEVAGIKASYNSLAAEYNSQMSKFNWQFAEKGKLPPGATDPLPREFKPYVTN